MGDSCMAERSTTPDEDEEGGRDGLVRHPAPEPVQYLLTGDSPLGVVDRHPQHGASGGLLAGMGHVRRRRRGWPLPAAE